MTENFFVFDSNNLQNIHSHMYGYSVSIKGILTNNYYKQKGKYEVPDPQGVYVMIIKVGNELKLYQDFHGNFGLYFYENKQKNYFALSNSFLLLEEYLIDKQYISINKDFTDNFIVERLCSPSIYETMIKEITKIVPNTFLIIDIVNKTFKFKNINYEENSIPFESEEGLKIIDKWVDKWGYIIRSLIKKTNNVSTDLSGGFDTRTVLSIFLSSGIDINKLLVISDKDEKHCHKEDFKIASNISYKYGFKLNNYNLDNNGIQWGLKNTLLCTIYSKLGFHKEFYLRTKFFKRPRFKFHGGGEVRGYPALPIKKYIEEISSQGRFLGKDFYLSSERLCKRSVDLIKKNKKYNNDYEIACSFYSKGRSVNHDGKTALEGFIANTYYLQPLIDPDIKKIKFDVNSNSTHDLIAFIYIRFAEDLVNFEFQGNRTLNSESIKKAKRLNKLFQPYKIKSDYNNNFYIDVKRMSPVPKSDEQKNADLFLSELFNSSKFIHTINKLYKNHIYQWAYRNIKKSNYFPLRHLYGLLSVAITIDCLSLNELYMNKFNVEKDFKENKRIIDLIQ